MCCFFLVGRCGSGLGRSHGIAVDYGPSQCILRDQGMLQASEGDHLYEEFTRLPETRQAQHISNHV